MNSTKFSASRVRRIKDHILGKRYELSLVFCRSYLSRKLNRVYRKKDKPTNVLAFPLSSTSGEIFINLDKLKPFSIPELFIHACLHLKGMGHGSMMEEAEKSLLKKFFKLRDVTPNSRRY